MLYVICLHHPAKVNSLYVQTFRANKPILILILILNKAQLLTNQNEGFELTVL